MASIDQEASKGLLHLGQIVGARFRLHSSCWFLAAGSFAFALVIARAGLDYEPLEALILATVSAGLLLLINLVHELGHVLAGAILGLRPQEVVVFGWGAKTDYGSEVYKPRDLAVVTLAGPAGNLLVAILLAPAIVLFSGQLLGTVALLICLGNLAYAGLNLAPLYPRDGGKVLLACLWHFTQDENKAVSLCRQCGLVLVISLVTISIFYGNVGAALVIAILSGESMAYDLGSVLRGKLPFRPPSTL